MKPRYRVRARRGFRSIEGGMLDGEEAPNVQTLNVVTSLDLPADRVLRAALGQLDKVVVLGFAEDGSEYFASSLADGGTVMWLMERCKKKMLDVPEAYFGETG